MKKLNYNSLNLILTELYITHLEEHFLLIDDQLRPQGSKHY